MYKSITVLFALTFAFANPSTAQNFTPPQLKVPNYGQNAGGWRVGLHPRMLADVNGDTRADIVAFGNAGAYVSLGRPGGDFSAPRLVTSTFGYNAGGWRVAQHPRMMADVNGDGRDDIVGFGNAGVYVALGQADGTMQAYFKASNQFGYNAGGWRVEQHPRMMADVNGDGRDDIVGFGNSGAYVALAQPNGSFSNAVLASSTFGYVAGGWRVSQHPRMMADVNGDGRADIVGFGNAGVYTALGLANGRFGPHRLASGTFGYNAGGWRVSQHPRMMADVNGDGRDDIVGFGNAGAYVALGQVDGRFGTHRLAINNFGYSAGGWRVQEHPRMMADTNGDGRDDIIGFGNAGAYVSLGQANGNFAVPTLGINSYGKNAGGWQVAAHPRLTGDVDGDGRADIVGFGNAGTYVSLGSRLAVRDLYVRRFTGATLTNADADRILTDTSQVLQIADSSTDVATPLQLRRGQGVDVFNVANGIVSSEETFREISNLDGDAKVVNAIQWCGNTRPGVIGCALTPGSSFLVVRFAPALEGILWAHEFGHNQGNPHRNGEQLVMNPFIVSTARQVNATESARFMGPLMALPGGMMLSVMEPATTGPEVVENFKGEPLAAAAINEAVMLQAALNPVPIGSDVVAFVQAIYIEGLPYQEATRFSEEDIPALLEILADPEQRYFWQNALTVLGIIGGDQAAQTLIDFADDAMAEPSLDPETYRAALDAVLALGYAVNRDGNQIAIEYLADKASAIVDEPVAATDPLASQEPATGLRIDTVTAASSAILGLSLAGRPQSKAILEGLAGQPEAAMAPGAAMNSPVAALIADALVTHEKVSASGLGRLYQDEETTAQ